MLIVKFIISRMSQTAASWRVGGLFVGAMEAPGRMSVPLRHRAASSMLDVSERWSRRAKPDLPTPPSHVSFLSRDVSFQHLLPYGKHTTIALCSPTHNHSHRLPHHTCFPQPCTVTGSITAALQQSALRPSLARLVSAWDTALWHSGPLYARQYQHSCT